MDSIKDQIIQALIKLEIGAEVKPATSSDSLESFYINSSDLHIRIDVKRGHVEGVVVHKTGRIVKEDYDLGAHNAIFNMIERLIESK